MRYLPRVSSPDTPTPSGDVGTATSSRDSTGAWSTFPRSAGSRPPGNNELPTIGTVQPRRGFPKLSGSTSGSAAGMGPSAARLSRNERGTGSEVSGPARKAPGAQRTGASSETNAPTRLDSDSLASRYRRAAAKGGGEVAETKRGPATGRLVRDGASKTAPRATAPTRDSREIASPSATTPKNPAARVARARENARSSAGNANETTKPPTLRDRAMANPKRTRDFLNRNSPVSGPVSTAIGFGLSYGYGWPGCGTGWYYGDYCDGWSYWFNWCGGMYPYGWQCYPYGGWYGSYWGCWPYGAAYWWWSCLWYPYWYSDYYPSTVVVYEREEPASYPVEEPAAVGEGVLEEGVQPGRPVEDSVGELLSPGGQATARSSMQNLTLGDSAFREGRYGDAVHFYAKAIEFQPDEGVLYLVLSDALFATGDYHYGAYALRKALELDPSLLDNPIDKHGFYADPAEFERQLAVLETYLKDRPTDQDARILLAANYLFGLRPAAAVDLLESAPAEALRKTSAGVLLLEAARRQQYEAAKEAQKK